MYRKGTFEDAYLNFLKLLEGENKGEFQEVTNELVSRTYPYAKLAVKKLQDKYHLKTYLMSLTSDFIAEAAKRQFGFEGAFAIEYGFQVRDSMSIFTGVTPYTIRDAQSMKMHMLKQFSMNKRDLKFICFFDSDDDVPIAKAATIRVGINPRPKLLNAIHFDLILNDEKDPWKAFYYII